MTNDPTWTCPDWSRQYAAILAALEKDPNAAPAAAPVTFTLASELDPQDPAGPPSALGRVHLDRFAPGLAEGPQMPRPASPRPRAGAPTN